MKGKLMLFLALLLGGVTTYLLYEYLQDYEVATAGESTLVQVVSANGDIEKGQKIVDGNLKLTSVAENSVHPNSVLTKEEIIGKYTTADMVDGEIFLSHDAQSEKEEELFVAKKITDGKRATSIGVNFVQSVSNLIEPENYVDVISSKVEKVGEKDEVKSTVLLENVRVLAVGRRLVEVENGEDYVEYSSVTLELTKEESVRLIKASQEGSIHLILHSQLIEKE